jgi:hypothetical protein
MDDVTRTNTEKVLYPATGFTKGEVLDYRERVAPALLPRVRGRPASFKRFPDGVDAEGFFQKNAPRGTPDCHRRPPGAGGGSRRRGRHAADRPGLRIAGLPRDYTARDPEGNLWSFGTYLPQIPPTAG